MSDEARFRYLRCKIESGGFSSERTFEIELASGDKVVGAANVQYFRDSECEPLDEETPGYSESIDGYVKCRVIRERDQAAWIDVPGINAVLVPQDAIAESCTVE